MHPLAVAVESFSISENSEKFQCEFLVAEDLVKRLIDRGEKSKVSQLLKLVYPGMAYPSHIFRGLKRPMKVHGNGCADKAFDVYCWLPDTDFEFSNVLGEAVPLLRPKNSVFVAVVNIFKEPFRGSIGKVVNWHWVEESNVLPLAPVDFDTRYEKHLWSAK